MRLLSEIIRHIFPIRTYESELKSYILKNNPKDILDVERLTIEYQRKKDSFI
jgi:hypothetical protein